LGSPTSPLRIHGFVLPIGEIVMGSLSPLRQTKPIYIKSELTEAHCEWEVEKIVIYDKRKKYLEKYQQTFPSTPRQRLLDHPHEI
jgi:hypothetical protein